MSVSHSRFGRGGEVPSDQVVDTAARTAGLSEFPGVQRSDPGLGAQPPHPPLGVAVPSVLVRGPGSPGCARPDGTFLRVQAGPQTERSPIAGHLTMG